MQQMQAAQCLIKKRMMKIISTLLLMTTLYVGCNTEPSPPPCPNSDLSGMYKVNGTKASYIGNVEDSVLASVLIIDTVKEIFPVSDSQFVGDYSNLGSLDWQYIFTINKATCELSAEPNEVMASLVSANSFVTYAAAFDANTKTIHVKTKYKNTSGNDNIIEEFFTPE